VNVGDTDVPPGSGSGKDTQAFCYSIKKRKIAHVCGLY
jgi:hypothetical protein